MTLDAHVMTINKSRSAKNESGFVAVASISIGFLVNTFITTPIHEGGHFLAAKALGYNAHIVNLINPFEGSYTDFSGGSNSSFDFNAIALGAPAAEYAFAIALSSAGKKMKNHLLRTSAKITSTILGFEPLRYSVGSYFSNPRAYTDDYSQLATRGIGYEITIPVALVLGLANAYFALREKSPQTHQHTKQITTYTKQPAKPCLLL